jgi:hypothetical protein
MGVQKRHYPPDYPGRQQCLCLALTVYLRDTQVYLSMTPELLREASQRFERYAGKGCRHA